MAPDHAPLMRRWRITRVTTAPPTIRLAIAADIPALAGVLARAFAGDPFFTFLAADTPDRHERMVAGWTGILRYNSARLSDTYTTDDRGGVAIWLPPGYRNPPPLDAIRMIPAIARLAGWGRLRSIVGAVDRLERRRHHHVPQPHYYLSALGVEPGRQGQGIGSALMAPILARCDERRLPAYLETSVARNLPLYERHGFAAVEELSVPGTDVSGWAMLRQPR